jgi:hypothetical protein
MGMLLLQNRHACCMACCCFKTGMHAAWHAAASKPACVLHGMLLFQQQQLLLRACVRAWLPS